MNTLIELCLYKLGYRKRTENEYVKNAGFNLLVFDMVEHKLYDFISPKGKMICWNSDDIDVDSLKDDKNESTILHMIMYAEACVIRGDEFIYNECDNFVPSITKYELLNLNIDNFLELTNELIDLN